MHAYKKMWSQIFHAPVKGFTNLIVVVLIRIEMLWSVRQQYLSQSVKQQQEMMVPHMHIAISQRKQLLRKARDEKWKWKPNMYNLYIKKGQNMLMQIAWSPRFALQCCCGWREGEIGLCCTCKSHEADWLTARKTQQRCIPDLRQTPVSIVWLQCTVRDKWTETVKTLHRWSTFCEL